VNPHGADYNYSIVRLRLHVKSNHDLKGVSILVLFRLCTDYTGFLPG
jgi:hypothetical protein